MSEASSSSEINAPVSIYIYIYIYIYILYDWPFGPAGVPNIKWCQCSNVTDSLKVEGRIR